MDLKKISDMANFHTIEAFLIELHKLVHQHKGYILTKGYNSVMQFD